MKLTTAVYSVSNVCVTTFELLCLVMFLCLATQVVQAHSQPYDNGGSFSSDFGLFWGFENWSSIACLGKTSTVKIMIDDVTLWSKLESICQVYLILLILFQRRTILKMLVLE